MKQHVIFAMIVSVILAVGGLFQYFNPEPPVEYEIVYFGAHDCGACKQWKAQALPDWKQTAAGGATRLTMAEARSLKSMHKGGFGSRQALWDEAQKVRTVNVVPTFALKEGGEITGVYPGFSGWKRVMDKVSVNHARKQRLAARREGQAPPAA